MAPNGATASRKTPAASKTVNHSAALESLFDDLQDETNGETKENIKQALPGFKKPGNWDSEVIEGKKTKPLHARGPPRMNKVPASLAKAFVNSRPMSDRPEILRCNHCKRAVVKHAMHTHVEECLNKKQEKQRKKKEAKDARDAAARKERYGTAGDSDDDDDDEGKKPTGEKNGGFGASKKRKVLDGDDEGAPAKKKKKKDDRTKAPKPKAPVDVEKQCGVELPNGGQCARSLTCKSHSMGAKRAVRRSAPYDKLLMEYQRKNQAKLQKAQFDASAPNPEDENLPTGPVDSDEEKEAMMSAIQRSWGGRPLYDCTPAPLRSKYQHNRIKGMLQAAFGGRSGVGLFGTAAGAGSAVSASGFFGASFGSSFVDEPGTIVARRGSVVPGARTMMPPNAESRRTSVAAA